MIYEILKLTQQALKSNKKYITKYKEDKKTEIK